jgi:uncharacterized alkaline shock family protein YloU
MVSRRAVVDLVRAAALGSYGVTGFADPNLAARLRRWAHVGPSGIRVRLHPRLEIDVWLAIAWGLPVAEVARQVDSAVRYGIRRALGREVDALAIHVNRLRVLPGPTRLAASGPAAQPDAGPAAGPAAR